MLDTLTPKQAEAIRLVRIDRHTAESAAELLGLPPTTVRKRIKDGIDALRKRASRMVEVVNIRKAAYDVLIARPSKWGNPFQIGRDGTESK